MARQQRSTTFAQESTRPITQVALYARVSTLNNQDPEMQLAELREYACRRGWQIVEEFTDQGVSGCNESRPVKRDALKFRGGGPPPLEPHKPTLIAQGVRSS
jgi:predicted site-specific integrase-resolvase